MRAATNKPAWYQRKGLPVPHGVISHRLEMLRRKQMRTQTSEDLMKMRAEFAETLAEMRAEGAVEEEEIAGLEATINTMPLTRKQGMHTNTAGTKKLTPLRKEYPGDGTE
jgi:hypothetical protein